VGEGMTAEGMSHGMVIPGRGFRGRRRGRKAAAWVSGIGGPVAEGTTNVASLCMAVSCTVVYGLDRKSLSAGGPLHKAFRSTTPSLENSVFMYPAESLHETVDQYFFATR